MKNAHLNENSSDGYRGLCIFIYFAWESNPFALLSNSTVTTQLQEHRQDLCDFKHGMVARQLVWVFPKLPTYWDFHAQPSKRIVRDRRNIQRVSILWVEMSCSWQRSEENDQTGLKATRCKPIWPSEHISMFSRISKKQISRAKKNIFKASIHLRLIFPSKHRPFKYSTPDVWCFYPTEIQTTISGAGGARCQQHTPVNDLTGRNTGL